MSFKQKTIYINSRLGINKLLRHYADAYESKHNPLPKTAPKSIKALSGWSFVVITDGRSKENLDIFITSAYRELKGTPHEIIVIGPPALDISYHNTSIPIRHIPYYEKIIWGVNGWITKKKNTGIRATIYDKLVVSHDYISFNPGWKKGYDTFGDFSACTNVILNKDGTRHHDWMVFDYPGAGQGLIPYETTSLNQYQYLNGTYFVVKRDFMLDNLLDEKLRWGEGEDVEWSKQVRKIITFKFNQNSVVTYSKMKPPAFPLIIIK